MKLLATLSLFVSISASALSPVDQVAEFYNAFTVHDSATMASLYDHIEADQVVFTDPVFPNLTTRETQAMWAMFGFALKQDPNFAFEFEVDENASTNETVIAHWKASYTFSSTGNTVVNYVTSTFTFADSKLVSQKDDFSLCKWARQALGTLKGTAACTFAPEQIRSNARAKLEEFMKSVY